jgi:hypothetical protein
MSLFDRVRIEILPNTVLRTPVRRYPFKINDENNMVLFSKVSNKKPFSKIPKICWDGIPSFLRGKGWVKIGQNFGVAPQNSLQEYLDTFLGQGKTHSSEANHVASVLEHLGVVKIDRSPPSRLRLIANIRAR